MTVIVREENKTTIKRFRRKGLKYYLFIFSLKLYRIEYSIIND